MNCIEFEAELANHVETRNAVDVAAMEHASRCPDCRAAWQIHQQLDAVIAAWKPVEISSGLADRVMKELTRPDQTPVRSNVSDRCGISSDQESPRVTASRGKAISLLGAAACLLVGIISLAKFAGSHPDHLTSRTLTRQAADENPSLDVSLTLSEVLSDLRSEYREIASETKSVAMDLVHRLPGQIEFPRSPETDEIMLRPTPSDVSRIWAPIGSRVETALGFLWQAVPADVPSG